MFAKTAVCESMIDHHWPLGPAQGSLKKNIKLRIIMGQVRKRPDCQNVDNSDTWGMLTWKSWHSREENLMTKNFLFFNGKTLKKISCPWKFKLIANSFLKKCSSPFKLFYNRFNTLSLELSSWSHKASNLNPERRNQKCFQLRSRWKLKFRAEKKLFPLSPVDVIDSATKFSRNRFVCYQTSDEVCVKLRLRLW